MLESLRCLAAGVALAALFGTSVASPAPPSALPREDLNWIRFDTPDFTFFSYATEYKTLRVVEESERFWAVLEQLIPGAVPERRERTTVYVFASSAGFAPYNRSGVTGVFGGYYAATLFGPVVALSVDPRTHYRRTVYHEYVHGFLGLRNAGMPLWLSEGLAEYLSTLVPTEEGANVGGVLKHHLDEIRTARWAPLRWTLGLTKSSSTYSDADRAGPFYAHSWLLVHYVLHNDPTPLTIQQLLDMCDSEEPVDQLLMDSLGLEDWELEGALREYAKRKSYRSSSVRVGETSPVASPEIRPVERATVLVRLGELLAFAHGELSRADEHFREAIRLAPESVDALAGLTYVLERSERPEDAAQVWARAKQVGSPGHRDMLVRASGILEAIEQEAPGPGDVDDDLLQRILLVRKLLERSIEIEPECGEAHHGLGRTYFYTDDDPRPGIAALETARQLLPDREDVETNLAMLRAKAAHSSEHVPKTRPAETSPGEPAFPDWVRGDSLEARTAYVQQLIDERNFDEAIRLLTGMIASETNPITRSVLEGNLERLREDAKRSACYDRFNEAVGLTSQGKFEEAYAIVVELEPIFEDPRLEEAVDKLLDYLRARLGK